MNRGQFSDQSCNVPGSRRFWFQWTMTSGTAFTINRSTGLLAGAAGIVRAGTGVYDIFPEQPPGVALVGWWIDCILATEASVTLGGTGRTSIVNNLVSASKVTATFRRADTRAATDLVATDIVYGYLDIQTVSA